MKQISTSLVSKLKQDSVTERDYIIFKGETTRHYLWFNLYDDCYKDGNFIGTFVMKRIEITYNDSDLEFKNKEFNAYKEYKLDNKTWESINCGTFVVTNVDPSDTKEKITVTAYDYTLKFANTYKTNLDYASGTITLFQVLQEVCQKVGVELENTSIENGDFIVDSNQFSEDSMYGNVVTAIAQISCNFAKITPENKLKLLLKNETNIIIETKDYEEFEDKRDTLPYTAVSLGLSDIEGENVTLVAPDVDPDNAKYLTINDNPFAYTQEKRTQLIQAIFDKINGFGYSSFVLDNCLYPQLECGDLVQIRNKEGQLVDSIVLRPTFEEVVLNFEAPSTITSTVEYAQPLSAIETAKRAERKVDKANLVITDVVEEVGQYDSRITSVEQSVDKIEQQVNEAITLIRDVEGNGSITLENTSNTSLYKLSIKGDISLLFGNDGKQYGQPQFFREDLYFSEDLLFTEGVPLAEPLYPSSNLFGKNMNLIIEYKEDDKEVYKLPFTYLNYLSQEVADEFILEDGKAKIIRRVGINSSMQKYELPNEVLEELGDFTIPLKEGNPKLYLQCFDSAIYNATYMIKNAYTEEFATKVELNSSITQTKEQINLEVSKKIDENEVIASINLTSEEAKINASKITLEGIVTANENFKVLLDGSIEAKNGTFSGDITSNNAVITGGSLTVGSKFKVTSDGTLTATGGTFSGNITSNNAIITGGSLTVGNKFKVTSDGTLTANNGTFSGTITADSGTIGGASIDSQGVFFNSGNNGWGLWGTTNHANIILHAGANSSNIGGAPFRVLNDGTVYATKANITGAITATSGTIAGFNIGSDRLYYGNTAINRNGNVEFRNDNGYFAIGSRSVNLHGSGMQHPVTISDMLANSGTGDVNASIGIRAYYGNINISSNEYSIIKGSSGVYINDQFYAGSSSKNTKENIKKLKENETSKIYELVKNLEVYQYDYKKEYSGRKDNVGFMIEDIEETILEKFLHVHQDNDDNNKKNYNNEDLIKILLVVIKELQKKIDKIGG